MYKAYWVILGIAGGLRVNRVNWNFYAVM